MVVFIILYKVAHWQDTYCAVFWRFFRAFKWPCLLLLGKNCPLKRPFRREWKIYDSITLTQHIYSCDSWCSIASRAKWDTDVVPCLWPVHTCNKKKHALSSVHGNVVPHPHNSWARFHANATCDVQFITFFDFQSHISSIYKMRTTFISQEPLKENRKLVWRDTGRELKFGRDAGYYEF